MPEYSLFDLLPFSATVKTMEAASLALLTPRTVAAAFSLLLAAILARSTNPAAFGLDFERL